MEKNNGVSAEQVVTACKLFSASLEKVGNSMKEALANMPAGNLKVAPEETNDLRREVGHLRHEVSVAQSAVKFLTDQQDSRVAVLKAQIADAMQENEKLRTALLDYKCFNCDGCYVDMSRCTRGKEHCAEAEHNTMARAGLAIDEKV